MSLRSLCSMFLFVCLVVECFQIIGVQLQSLTLKGGRFLWGQILGQVVRAVATASPVRSETKGAQERLLLHISSSPRRFVYLSHILWCIYMSRQKQSLCLLTICSFNVYLNKKLQAQFHSNCISCGCTCCKSVDFKVHFVTRFVISIWKELRKKTQECGPYHQSSLQI